MLIFVALIAVTTVLLNTVNLKREYRAKQLPAVYISGAVSLMGTAAAYALLNRMEASELIPVNMTVAALNIAIAAVFILVKAIFCIAVGAGNKNNAQSGSLENEWYEFDEDNSIYFLKNRYGSVHSIFKALSWMLAVVCTAVIAMGIAAGRESGLWLNMFPVAALIIITEIGNFLSGYTKSEYLHLVYGEDAGLSRHSAYYKIRRVYEELFPSALLVSHTGNEFFGRSGATDLIEEFCNSDVPIEQEVGKYFSNLKKKNGLFDVDLVSMTSILLQKKSAVVFNPFYKDMSEYLLLPIIGNLLNNKKCLIIVGRSSMAEDAAAWVKKILDDYFKTTELWRVEKLSEKKRECDIGIISSANIYDIGMLNTNDSFFQNTGFVILIEPSKMIATYQQGLEIITEKFDENDYPTFCIFNHYVDGLVDTMSHILRVNITNVVAAPVPNSVYTAMGWASSGDFIRQKLFNKQTRYLGNGIELAAAAIKNQVPHITWYGTEKAPVKDIRWIAGQYYPQICNYAHIKKQQSELDKYITFSSNLWGSKQKEEEFVIAEDEFCNLFVSMRAYMTRGKEQSFVNVISENYLLRDYMRYNRQLFMTDSKAVPVIAPYYAKTERNVIYKLIMMMADAPVDEEYIIHEMSLLGYESDNVYDILTRLISRYTDTSATVVTVRNEQKTDSGLVPVPVCKYSIPKQVFNKNFSETLRNAFFVVEDEKFGKEYLDARLFEHITQTVMPGQFITYNGKYYKVHAISPEVGCILHRAADSYTERKYYRQIRTYHFGESCDLISARKVTDVEITLENREFTVSTSGYFEMKDNDDLRNAKIVDLSCDPCIDTFTRRYKNKPVLRISLPDTDINIRFTISILLEEMFRSIFPDAWPYLAVLSSRPENIEGILDDYNYHIDGAIDKNMIYIVEDSGMDLGLLDAIDNNLMRIFEILADYLDWHFQKMREAPHEDPVPPKIEPVTEKEQNRKSLFSRVAKAIMRLFGVSEKKDEEEKASDEDAKESTEKEDADDNQTEIGSDKPLFEDEEEDKELGDDVLVEHGTVKTGKEDKDKGNTCNSDNEIASNEKIEAEGADERSKDSAGIDPTLPQEEQIVVHSDGESLFAADGVPDDLDILMPIEPTRYQKECFLKFGFEEIDERLAIEDVRNYLKVRGWSDSDLSKARKRTELDKSFIDLNAENYCDFCGIPLTGVSFERLLDGRTRCNDCSSTAINDVSEFKELFLNTETMMKNTFDITFNVPIAIRVTDAQTIAKHTGSVFKPTTKSTARVLGFARRAGGKYDLFIESGSPRLGAINTVVHEVTHIWQYVHWKDDLIRSIYKQSKQKQSAMACDIVYEGMAMWASIQLLYSMGEAYYAWIQEQLTAIRNDVYGIGFRLYRDRYGLIKNGEEPAFTPFVSFPPLDPEEVRKIFREEDTDGLNK